MATKTRSIDQIIQGQVQKWEMDRAEQSKVKERLPVITVAREPGSQGRLVAEGVADQLGMEIFHRKIIQRMADSADISTSLLETMDEKRVSILDDWISTAVSERHLWPDEYLEHLMKVIGTIGEHGGAVLLGRGANFIIPPGESFRVRVVSPLEKRIDNVARKYSISFKEARRRIRRTESNRKAFIRKHFHADIADPVNYDLVINTGSMTIETAVKTIIGALGRQ